MTSAAEVFVIAVARASRRARRHLRHVSSADRDDILATAILWCWQNRAGYDPSVPLEEWFVNAVRDAKKAWLRGDARNAEELSDTLAAPDDTLTNAAVHEAAQQVLSMLSATERKVIALIAEGRTRAEVVAKGFTVRQYNDTRAHVRKLRRHLAETGDLRPLLRAGVTPSSMDPDEAEGDIVTIDFAPHEGQECPPCWKCKWFEGLLPPRKRSTRMDIVEPDVRKAVEATEARKVSIAQSIIDGTLHGRRQ